MMLENFRFNAALLANAKWTAAEAHEVFLAEQFKTQHALDELGVHEAATISDIDHVGMIRMIPEYIPTLRIPFAVEVLGMPGAGKTSAITRYMEELWIRGTRHTVHHVNEGARTIKDEFGDLRYTDPLLYSMLAGVETWRSYYDAMRHINVGMRVATSDRGMVDRRVFRRAFFSQGFVHPGIAQEEEEFINQVENTPIQVGAIILFMIRPESSMLRKVVPGPVTNMQFLPLLYEQYWRLHYDILQNRVPYRLYTCIDAERSPEEVYESFKYAMDKALGMHSVFLYALAKAFPEEFDEALAKYRASPPGPSFAEKFLSKKLGGKKVLIVGGEEMKSENDILERDFIEGLRVK